MVMPGFPTCYPARCFDVGEGVRFLNPSPPNDHYDSVTRMDLALKWTSTLGKGR